MKLLILTQKVDESDDVLGFMTGWIEEFSRQTEKITTICLYKGEYYLPENVSVLSLGKESLNPKAQGLKLEASSQKIFLRLRYVWNFYRYIWQERNNYDAVFVHMNYEYVILGWIFWKLFGKKIGLWYAHGHVPFFLRLAEKMTDIVFTSTKSGFRIESDKKKVVGQGISLGKFKTINYLALPDLAKLDKLKTKNFSFKIVSVGRISPVKDYEILIKSVEILKKEMLEKSFEVEIAGSAGTSEQETYFEKLKKDVLDKKIDNCFRFVGSIPNKDIPQFLTKADLFVNMSRTGSLDKAILEAMASGVIILTPNEALKEVLGDLSGSLMFEKGDSRALADKIKMIMNMGDAERIDLGNKLRGIVERDHSLPALIKKILNFYK